MSYLRELPTRAPEGFEKATTKEELKGILKELDELQYLLYAEGRHSVLVILQGMDASGKDGAIKNVFGSLNPQGVSVKSFKVPTEEEKNHDFLWRVHQQVPEKGKIKIFNRSHYEDVLVTRVHGWCSHDLARQRFRAINDFECLLQLHNDTLIFKFYLHISREEQQERLKERMEDHRKHWKYNAKDFDEAELWDKYMEMYEAVFENCNTPSWIVVPADQNWYKEYLIAKTVTEGLKKLNMKYPEFKP